MWHSFITQFIQCSRKNCATAVINNYKVEKWLLDPSLSLVKVPEIFIESMALFLSSDDFAQFTDTVILIFTRNFALNIQNLSSLHVSTVVKLFRSYCPQISARVTKFSSYVLFSHYNFETVKNEKSGIRQNRNIGRFSE